MIEIGEKPILWHIMKTYSYYGHNEFIICLGYKGYSIKEYFAHYFLHESDVTFDFTKSNERIVHQHTAEPWKVTLVNTGTETMTGGRIKRIKPHIGKETFMVTYGDGISDIDINKLVKFHKAHGKSATITSVQPLGRFGVLNLSKNSQVLGFEEKPKGDKGWINAGFFVFEPEVFDYIEGDDTILEKYPLETLAKDNHLMTYQHQGFWHPMDTIRDKNFLETLWKSKKAPWKLWKN